MLGYLKVMVVFAALVGAGAGVCLWIARLPVSATTALAAARGAGALAGSMAGVIASQLLCVPALAVLFAMFWCLQRLIGQLDGGAQVAWNLTVIVSMLGLFLAATVAGFVAGWGVGARVAGGAPFRHSVSMSRLFGAFTRRDQSGTARVQR